MKKFLLKLIPVVILFTTVLSSQTKEIAQNSIHLELLGNGLIYSLNYERIIVENFGARLGIGYWQVNESGGDNKTTLMTVPVMVNYLLGSKSSKLELGVGICYINYSEATEEFLGVDESATLGTATFAYRYQRPEGGIMFRAGVTPLFGSIGFQLWFGVGFGYAF